MIIGNVTVPILRNRVENHAEVKDSILKAIDEFPRHLVYNKKDTIFNSDYTLPRSFERRYWNFVQPIIERTTIKSLFEEFKCKEIQIDNYWFQQYQESDSHGWHTHGGTHWTNVYFVELPDEKLKTEILDMRKENYIEYEAKEGDIITFPSFLYHRSPINDTRERKTIISFNLTDYSEDK